MTAIMTNPINIERPDWQPGQNGQLSYQNPTSITDSSSSALPIITESHSLGRAATTKGLSIREIREALPKENVTIAALSPTTAATRASKNKKSFFGGIFAKEPTMMALDQVTQQMIAQHGSISPRTVPSVSSAKMPEHVPKVNTKWDGVPEYVKMKEKQEQERTRATKRMSLLTVKSQPRSTDIAERPTIRRSDSNADSAADSWDSRSTGSQPVFQDDPSLRPESVYSTSSTDSLKPAQRGFSETSRSSVSTPGSHSANAPFSASETSFSRPGFQRARSSQSTSTQLTASTGRSRLDRSPRVTIPPADAIPEYTSSPIMTPVERSPRTPALLSDDEGSLTAQLASEFLSISSGPKILAVPESAQRTAKKLSALITSDSSLADALKSNSRAGLGIETTIVVKKEPIPNQYSNLQSVLGGKSHSSHKNTPTSPRGKGRYFTRDKNSLI